MQGTGLEGGMLIMVILMISSDVMGTFIAVIQYSHDKEMTWLFIIRLRLFEYWHLFLWLLWLSERRKKHLLNGKLSIRKKWPQIGNCWNSRINQTLTRSSSQQWICVVKVSSSWSQGVHSGDDNNRTPSLVDCCEDEDTLYQLNHAETGQWQCEDVSLRGN